MKLIIAAIASVLFLHSAYAVHGLEGIVVERYYCSDKNDSVVTDKYSSDKGTLPVGSITYRIYADMLPGYKFQAAFGIPGHPLKISTST